ncbi:unnamed protein product [Linum tenue]|uniref:Transcription factor Iwr1 domain-containing protein n=1 Tax=Linum tenue TaxID=586396 RepID=A0AAV0I7L1_9ROSI|nr:unnamed protein product [Linum tenue]
MANVGEGSSAPPISTDGVKPVVVRVKRKLHQSILDAFCQFPLLSSSCSFIYSSSSVISLQTCSRSCSSNGLERILIAGLEINERPSKRATFDLAKLSLGDSANGNGEESKTRKVLVQHVETISTSESTVRVVKSFVPNSVDVVEAKTTTEDLKRTFKSVNQIAKSARFQQIWSKRKETEEAVHDMCHFYDVIRIDAESSQEKQKQALSVEDQKLLSSYLPFLKELIPDAAGEIEAEISASTSQEDEYVYDYYTVNNTMDIEHEDTPFPFPLVQVEDEDFYDGLDDESECDSEDSNAENHPFNEYPDESSEAEDELQSEDKSDDDGEENEEGGMEDEEEADDDENRSLLNGEATNSEDQYEAYVDNYLDQAYSFANDEPESDDGYSESD